mmetsp:Transcript_13703/g.26274  ORF Transcript_13703/g.26274 Transcript_13703/m.26274 type:complete len:188 (+) Transcript_13703:179-742(+)|eukprot:CAMPEP_0197484010 /NCGR_PEP_ID=MMETSP1309-20131121/57183_1 /TAXON_ID=464262 /ORGANISM="Genus nov. species nov., Strain RCC998" /LENGTH=187 /DNA_ID=CAMNT_0043026639 /DNA_START=494 /DNA_END=1057 /DNA_ORIENTATION=+
MTTTLARMPLCQNKAAGTTNALVHSSRRRLARNVTVRATPNKDAKVATTEGVVGRRGGVLLGLVGGLTAVARPAQAGLFGGIPEEVYVEDTTQVLGALKATLDLTSESADAERIVDSVRTESNKWVAKYRRQSNYQGRPSYGNTYSAINAILGHYNNFGANTLFPKRRLERVVKEVDDAGRALGRGR